MIVISWQNGYMQEALLVFDNTIRNIATAFQVCRLGGESVGVKMWAANDS